MNKPNEIVGGYNHKGIEDFEGYSPHEMHHILYEPFSRHSPFQLIQLEKSVYDQIPLLQQIKLLARILEREKELKLTPKGFLPIKIVAEVYEKGFLKDEMIKLGTTKARLEQEVMVVNLPRMLLELIGVIKKRNNKLSLTQKGIEILSDDQTLFESIFITCSQKFNWAFYDGYSENGVGQFGFCFSLLLLSKYGVEKRTDSFYAEKYFRALPKLREGFTDFGFDEDYQRSRPSHCYSIRTFDRFLVYFGLVIVEKEKKPGAEKFITKTPLFDQLVKFSPHSAKH